MPSFAVDEKDRKRSCVRGMLVMVLRAAVLLMLSSLAASTADAELLTVVYPKERSVVGTRVNLVLDPTSDWALVPFFQAEVGGVASDVVDTSTGRHAIQGLALLPGLNTVTIRVLMLVEEKIIDKDVKTDTNAPVKKEVKKEKVYKEISSQQITVFSKVDIFTGPVVPTGFTRELFHDRTNESICSGCHQMEALSGADPKKPEDVVCFTCHKNIPTGKNIHGPAAVWSCLNCHNPNLYPVKYQFASIDPWKVVKYTQPVVPQVFTIPSSGLFKPDSSVMLSKEQAVKIMRDALEYLNHNPGDSMRVEVHTHNAPLKKVKGKKQPFPTKLALTNARTKVLQQLFKQIGVSPKRLSVVAMGDKLPRSSENSDEARELNDRIEIIVYPADVKVVNSQSLPVLQDRERVIVNFEYLKGPRVTKFRIMEKLPDTIQYLKGSAYFKGAAREPKVTGDGLLWNLGDMDEDFVESLVFVVKKEHKDIPVGDTVRVAYFSENLERSRDFDPKVPAGRSVTVKEACLKCHPEVMRSTFTHGPAGAGYCTLCHDPHASSNAAWLRKPSWDLCVTCHEEKSEGTHVLTGFSKRLTHPTRKKRDPSRRGKLMSCASCHNPHSAVNIYLYTAGVKQRNDLCALCHRKKL